MSQEIEATDIATKFEGLTLEEDNIAVNVKRPKRVLHFSDGVIEEYSTDEEKDVVDKGDESDNVVDEVIFI